MTDVNPYFDAPSPPPFDVCAERERQADKDRQRVEEGRRRLASRFAVDSSASWRCARILATVGTDTTCWWDTREIVRERNQRRGDTLDEKTTEDDLSAMWHAGLIDVEERNDGDGEGPPMNHWSAYSIKDDRIDEFMMLGAQRWLARAVADVGRALVSAPVAKEKLLAKVRELCRK